MKRKYTFATIGFALLLVSAACLLSFHRAAPLPRIKFSDGGEFRVFQICYGTENDHHLGGAPPVLFWLWGRLPKQVQSVFPYPDQGVSGLSPSANTSAISIWWAYIDPITHKPEVGSTDYVTTTLDSGERLRRIWSEPTEEGYRQIFLSDPPRHSKRLRFQMGVEDQPIEFSIDNPAFKESEARSRSGARQDSGYFPPVEISVISEAALSQGGLAFQVQLPKSLSVRKNIEFAFEFEYSIVNLYNADMFLAVEPPDNVADSFSDFHGEGMSGISNWRYALLPRPNETDGRRLTYSTNRKALMSLRNPLDYGGRFHLGIYIEGYFRDTGQPFYGSTYVDLPVTILE